MRKLYSFAIAFALLTAGFPAGEADAQITIGTPIAPSSGFLLHPEFSPETGQTFTAPVDGSLLDFSFWYSSNVGDEPLSVVGRVFEWTTTGMGTELFASSAFELPASGSGVTKRTVGVGGVSVTAGSRYLLLFDASMALNPGHPGGNFGLRPGEPFAGGALAQHGVEHADHDLAFEATLRPAVVVSEPTSLVLLGTGLLALAGLGWQARRRSGTSIGI